MKGLILLTYQEMSYYGESNEQKQCTPSEDPAINQKVFVHSDSPSLQLSLKLLRLRSNCKRTPAIPMKETHAMAPLMVRIPQQGFIPHEKEDKSTKKSLGWTF